MTLLEIVGSDATLAHQHIIIGMIAVSIAFYTLSIIYAMRALKKKNTMIILLQQQYAAKVDNIRKEHSDALEKIRVEMLKREEERTHQWIESEKETLHVLNGVSILLDMSEKIGKGESEKILKVLDTIYGKVERLIDFSTNLDVLTIIKEKIEVLAIIKEKIDVLDIIKEKVEKLTLPE